MCAKLIFLFAKLFTKNFFFFFKRRGDCISIQVLLPISGEFVSSRLEGQCGHKRCRGEMTKLDRLQDLKCAVTRKWILNKSNQTWKRDLIMEQKINV